LVVALDEKMVDYLENWREDSLVVLKVSLKAERKETAMVLLLVGEMVNLMVVLKAWQKALQMAVDLDDD